MRSCKRVVIDSTTVEAKRGGEEVGYDGFKHRKGTKIHVIVDEESKPIAVAISPGNIHDSKMFNLTIR
jgi:transposase